MAPFSLQGLNVVQPAQPDTAATTAPDFSAHLDLWTNLAFESDEPLASSSIPPKRRLGNNDDDTRSPLGLPCQDGHEDAVFPSTVVPADPLNTPPLDIHALLAGFGIDPRLMPPAPPLLAQQNANPAPSFAQLLALHAAYTSSYAPPSPPSNAATSPPSAPSIPTHPSKRPRAQKQSSPADITEPHQPTTPQSSDELTQSDPSTVVLAAAEDKRRRNTAASARFRLKKKEREAALERRAKELEERVGELERECEGLRRENGWLKGLVVGVTGAGVAQHQQASAK